MQSSLFVRLMVEPLMVEPRATLYRNIIMMLWSVNIHRLPIRTFVVSYMCTVRSMQLPIQPTKDVS